MYLTTFLCIINPVGMHGCPRQLLTLYNSFSKAVEETDTYGRWWSNSRCTQTNTESFSISHLLLCKKHLIYLVHLGLEQALGRFWHSSRNQPGEKAKRKILLKTPQSLSYSYLLLHRNIMNTSPQRSCHFSCSSSSGTGRCGSAGASGPPSRSLSRHGRAPCHDIALTSAQPGAAASITSAPPLLAGLGAAYVLYKCSLELPVWSVAHLSSSRAAMECPAIVNTDKDQKLEQ